MKKFVFSAKVIMVVFMACVSSYALADGKPPTQRVDTINVGGTAIPGWPQGGIPSGCLGCSNPGGTLVNPGYSGGGGGDNSSVGTIIDKIRKNTCVNSGENCDDYSSRVLKQCYLETGLSPGGLSASCRLLATDLGIACSSGQLRTCP
jgi:hypothetical protein